MRRFSRGFASKSVWEGVLQRSPLASPSTLRTHLSQRSVVTPHQHHDHHPDAGGARREASIQSCDIVQEGRALQLTLSWSPAARGAVPKPPITTTIPIEWLEANNARWRHGTGQRVTTLDDTARAATPLAKGLRITSSSCLVEAASSRPGSGGAHYLTITVSDGEPPWRIAIADIVEYGLRAPIVAPRASTTPGEQGTGGMVTVPFDALCSASSSSSPNSSRDAFRLISTALIRDGIALVSGCPEPTEGAATHPAPPPVERIARALSPVTGAIPTLYGTSWMVETKPSKGPTRNIAYTGEYLDLHNDLAYYESMPGLQLLHCITFHPHVKGGESFFVDAFECAEELRRRNPAAFRVLTEIPASFMKDDPIRSPPAKYYYSTPLLQCNHLGTLIKVMWAPAFEAPMPLTLGADTLKRYYAAYAEFAAILREWRGTQEEAASMRPGSFRFRTAPGTCVVFVQGRLLHGREAFVEPTAGMRRLQGCYVNIDDFRSAAAGACCFDTNLGEIAINNRSWY